MSATTLLRTLCQLPGPRTPAVRALATAHYRCNAANAHNTVYRTLRTAARPQKPRTLFSRHRQYIKYQKAVLASVQQSVAEWNQHSAGSKRRVLSRQVVLDTVAAASVLSLAYWLYTRFSNNNTVHADSSLPHNDALPLYTLDDVRQHGKTAERKWVIYNNHVYDITDFIASHPGGSNRIILAAGTSVEPFWRVYQQHAKPEVQNILKQYLIGRLDTTSSSSASDTIDLSDPYANEPQRNPALITLTERPCNAETPAPLLQSRITPNELFYVRNHMYTPVVKPDEYKLTVTGDGVHTTELSLQDIKTKFPRHTVEVTLQCAGNRRHEMAEIKPIKGLDWQCGAISNAVWSGAKLRDILAHSGLDVDGLSNGTANSTVKHIQMEGLDADTLTSTSYGASIPVHKAVSNTDDVIVAYEMNGVDIPADYGYPIRVVVPGVVGARSVKWCHKIVASPHESPSHWQQKDYKSFNPSVDWSTVDWSSAPAIQETPVTSAILSPSTNDKLSVYDDELNIAGYAYAGSGRDVIRVDVSIDNGITWHTAQLHKDAADAQRSKTWNWTQWSATLPVELKNQRDVHIICKATDSEYNSQPDTVAPIWNLRGVLNNAWHRVNLKVEDDDVKVEAASSPDISINKTMNKAK